MVSAGSSFCTDWRVLRAAPAEEGGAGTTRAGTFAERPMLKFSWLHTLTAAGFGLVFVGCGGTKQAQLHTAPTPPPAVVRPAPVSPAPPALDPVQALITESQQHYLKGQRELEQGHFDRARSEFNGALDVLLNAPGGARTEPRLREQFDRLVDKISALEVAALAAGDGFAEKPAEPASIDELLELSDTFDEPAPTPAMAAAVETDLAQTSHDIPIPLESARARLCGAVPGPAPSFIQDGLERGSQYLPMIQSVFRAEGLPLDLAYVPLIESAFKPNALSRATRQGRLAVHARHGARKRPAPRLVYRRTIRSGEGDPSSREIPENAAPHFRRRLAPGAGVVQRRARPRAARDEAHGTRQLLGAERPQTRLCRARRANTCR